MGQTEYFEYDEETLRLIQHTDFEGNITESVYSDLGFLDELQYFAPGSDPETDPADETVEYTYNSLDQREQITDTRGDTDYTYDEFDRLSQIDTPEGVLNYEYDNYGRQVRKSIGNPADPTHDWTYSYDALGRLKTVSTVRRNGVDLATAEVTTYSYDLVGNLSRVDYANGMITTYEYDALNRLDVMTHYSPDETPENLADNDKLAEYDYTVRADGRRTAVTEKYWESGTPYTTDIAWTYDNLGRLVEEDYDSHNNDLDYTTTFTYDLVGNRLSKVIDGVVDKTLTYEYDDNDRLLTSWKIIGEVDDGVNLETDDTTTTYGYTGTQQTSKTVEETYSTQTLSVVDYSYDLQGRMSEVVIDTYDSNSNIVKKETTTYVYDGRGIRVGSTYKVEEDTDQNPATDLVVTKHEETSYLVDDMNPTGYAQVIEKIVREAGTATVTDAKVFTLGHDVIDQTTFTPGDSQAGSPLTFLYDGHGSTRAVLDATAAFVQHYAYTAYGRAIGFDEAAALTTLLYSGEAFDSRVGLQYLRARWYDPNSGRFNRLDPFSGNLRDPQSLHKYLYTHGDPVNGWDPSGLFTMGEMLISIKNQIVARGPKIRAAFKAYDRANQVIDTITFVRQIVQLVTEISVKNMAQIRGFLSDAFAVDFKFRRRLQPKNLMRAYEVFMTNIPMIFGNLLKISSGGAGKVKKQNIINFFDALKTHRSRIVLMMPTPYNVPYPLNPKGIVPSGLRIQARGIRRSVSLYLGHGRFQGRMFGLGVVKSRSKTAEKKPFQLFRMDWHKPHGKPGVGQLDYWVHGRSHFHFHLVADRE